MRDAGSTVRDGIAREVEYSRSGKGQMNLGCSTGSRMQTSEEDAVKSWSTDSGSNLDKRIPWNTLGEGYCNAYIVEEK